MRSFNYIFAFAIVVGAHGASSADVEASIRQAVELARSGQTTEALTLLNNLQPEAGFPAAYFGVKGTLEARSGQFRAAQRDLSSALSGGLRSPDVLYTLGLVDLQLKRPSDARELLEQAVQKLPVRPEFWLALGQAYAQLDQQPQAITSFDKAYVLGSHSAAICFAAAVGYEGSFEFSKAAHALQRAAELDPNNGKLRTRCIRDLIHGGVATQAGELASKWRSDSVVTGQQHLEIGIVLAEARLYVDAAAEFQCVLRSEPSMVEAKYNLALVYFFEKNYQDSAGLALQLTESDTGGQGHEILGLIKEEQGDPIGARADFSEAARRDPHSADALFQLGRADLQLGKLTDAKREFSASRAACSTLCTAPLIGLATAYKLEGQYSEASDTVEEAIAQSPLDAVNYLYLGDIQIRANRLPDAEQSLLKAVQLDPQSSLAHYMYAYALIKQHPDEAPQAAIDSLKAAIRLDPESGLAYFRLGTILARRGDYMRAEALLAKAVHLEPALKEAHFQYATVLRKVGRPDLAENEIREFQALNTQRMEEDAEMMQELRHLAPSTP